MKIFDNPRSLTQAVIYWRLYALDNNVQVEIDPSNPKLVKISSSLTDGQIDAKLTAVSDAGGAIAARLSAARSIAGSIPAWATWTVNDWTTYYNANISATQINAITTLAEAKVILNKMSTVLNNAALMEIALRNKTFPDL